MATNAQNLETIKTNYVAALLTDSTSPKPSYSWEGRSVSRAEWRTALMENIKSVSDLIALEVANAPFEIPVEYVT